MRKANEKIRKALKENHMYQWQLADLLGISVPSITIKMRHELPSEEQDRIIAIIKGGGKA